MVQNHEDLGYESVLPDGVTHLVLTQRVYQGLIYNVEYHSHSSRVPWLPLCSAMALLARGVVWDHGDNQGQSLAGQGELEPCLQGLYRQPL